MVARGSGKIIFTASLLSFQGGINVVGLHRGQERRRRADPGAGERVGAARRQRQRDRARLHRHRQHRRAARRPAPQPSDPRPHPGRPLGGAGRPGRRDGVPGEPGVGLRARHRPARRRRVARDGDATSWSSTPAHRRRAGRRGRRPGRSAPRRSPRRSSRPASRSAEVTLRTPAALDGDLGAWPTVPGFVVGAGTVVSPEQVEQALAAGARFLVSPGFSAAVVRECRDARRPAAARGRHGHRDAGARSTPAVDTVKFFPAERRRRARRCWRRSRRRSPRSGSCPTGGIGRGRPRRLPGRCPPSLAVGRQLDGAARPDRTPATSTAVAG